MELTIQQILIAKEALKEFDKKGLPAKLSYWLGRLEDKLTPISERFQKERSKMIIEKYGVKTEGAESYNVPKEKLEDYTKEIEGILEQKEMVEIKLKLEMFEGVEVSKEFFISMGDLIVE